MRHTHSLIVVFILFVFPYILAGQWIDQNKNLAIISQERLKTHVYVLADTMAQGRATGTLGGNMAANYIQQCFQRYGLQPYNGNSFFQRFRSGNITGHNIAGILWGRYYPMEFLVISAHYDHLGVINGTTYPGADDNASGVALMLQVAEVFSQRARTGDPPLRSIIFVAYDGKEQGLVGSEYFAKTFRFPPQRVIANLNIDQIGCNLEPPNDNPEYVLVLGADHLTPDLRLVIDVANHYGRIGLDIDYTFYGSKNFSNIFFELSDQIHLAKLKVPSILYTSGIHAYTYKPADLPALVNYPVLERRTQLFYLIADDLTTRRSWLRRYY